MDADLLSDTFVALADTMTAEFDVIDFLRLLADRSTRLLSASAAAVALADGGGQLRMVAASGAEAGLAGLFQVHDDQGPSVECFRTGQPVTAAGLAGAGQRSPRFAAAAVRAGFGAVNVLPMRLRDQVIGTLNLFSAGIASLGPAELRTGQALADVATIGLLQERNGRRAEARAEQLQTALNSRVLIEQAKGKLAERLSLNVDQAFTLLRRHARNTNQQLADVARYVIDSPTASFPPSPRG